jgi:amino-acid N-acetyltransferase
VGDSVIIVKVDLDSEAGRFRIERSAVVAPSACAPDVQIHKIARGQSRGLGVPRLNIRPARVSDVPAIHDLIKVFADRKLMIRRSLGELYESIREFLVATDDEGRVLGCAALHVFWDDLAELKCLAVAESAQGQGLGRALINACWNAARELELATVFTLTYVADFFEKCGYHRIEKAELPHKIWNECVRCPLFPNCTEIALVRTVSSDRVLVSEAALAAV